MIPGSSRFRMLLPGCTPEPLMSYLKALGVFRLVAEQADPDARGHWEGNTFSVTTTLGEQELIGFFVERYRPTSIVVPWSGSDFFAVRGPRGKVTFTKTPTGARVIEAFLASTSDRLAAYRAVIRLALEALAACGITGKADLGRAETKAGYIRYLRAVAPEPLVDWIDAAAVLLQGRASFSVLLGSGGGSDGNTHFSDNFMQNLWEMLPDFDQQRPPRSMPVAARSAELLRAALMGLPAQDLAFKRTSSLFDSGAVGGPNATQGFEREALANPWNVILGLEGTLLFAGAAVKRFGMQDRGMPSFPFQFRLIASGRDGTAGKDALGREVWLPLWDRPAALAEIRHMLGEGRAQVGGRTARNGSDMARAVASLGVDRGVAAFWRYGIVKGRVGGENYNTAIALGRFDVRVREHVDLLREVDRWLERYRGACGNEAPARFLTTLRRIDAAILDYCRYGGPSRFLEILCALGEAEHHLALSEHWRSENRLPPIWPLSPDWIPAANDGTTEFALALALAGLHDAERKLGPIRANLEPVALGVSPEGGAVARWTEKDRSVTWTSADLATNLAATLERRVLDGRRLGCAHLPIQFYCGASLDTVAAFLCGAVDAERTAELLRGLVLIDQQRARRMGRPYPRMPGDEGAAPPLPRVYGLLKLLFLPGDLVVESGGDARPRARLARAGEHGIHIAAESRVVPLLRAGRVGEACSIAARRLRISGLRPKMDGLEAGAGLSGVLLAAALLVPLRERGLRALFDLVIHADAELVLASS